MRDCLWVPRILSRLSEPEQVPSWMFARPFRSVLRPHKGSEAPNRLLLEELLTGKCKNGKSGTSSSFPLFGNPEKRTPHFKPPPKIMRGTGSSRTLFYYSNSLFAPCRKMTMVRPMVERFQKQFRCCWGRFCSVLRELDNVNNMICRLCLKSSLPCLK